MSSVRGVLKLGIVGKPTLPHIQIENAFNISTILYYAHCEAMFPFFQNFFSKRKPSIFLTCFGDVLKVINIVYFDRSTGIPQLAGVLHS